MLAPGLCWPKARKCTRAHAPRFGRPATTSLIPTESSPLRLTACPCQTRTAVVHTVMIFHCFESMRGNVFSSFCAVLMTHYRPEKIDQTFRSMNVGTKTSAACDILTKLLVVVYLVSFSLQSAVRSLLKPEGFNASSFQTRSKAQKAHFFLCELVQQRK